MEEKGERKRPRLVLSSSREWTAEDKRQYAAHYKANFIEENKEQEPMFLSHVADVSDEEAEKRIWTDENGWDWHSMGPAPKKTICPDNEKLVAALKTLASFYKRFPDEIQLGPNPQSNDIRALQARSLYNFVRSLPERVVVASQIQLKGVSELWRQKIDTLLWHGELDIQKKYAEANMVLKQFEQVLWIGPATAWKLYEEKVVFSCLCFDFICSVSKGMSHNQGCRSARR